MTAEGQMTPEGLISSEGQMTREALISSKGQMTPEGHNDSEAFFVNPGTL